MQTSRTDLATPTEHTARSQGAGPGGRVRVWGGDKAEAEAGGKTSGYGGPPGQLDGNKGRLFNRTGNYVLDRNLNF